MELTISDMDHLNTAQRAEASERIQRQAASATLDGWAGEDYYGTATGSWDALALATGANCGPGGLACLFTNLGQLCTIPNIESSATVTM
jgi:hypothetical protein